jgi:hypothetical protein
MPIDFIRCTERWLSKGLLAALSNRSIAIVACSDRSAYKSRWRLHDI